MDKEKKTVLIKYLRCLPPAVLFAVGIAAVLATGGGGGTDSSSDNFREGELTEYQGLQLSPINDFRENSITGPKNVDPATYRLEISGLVENPTAYSYDEVINNFTHYSRVVTLNCVEGWSVDILWEGVLVRDVIAGALPAGAAKAIIFYSYDGYSTSFPIEYVMDNDIIMASKMNGLAIPPERGFPFELVAEDKWGYKWAKWITRIELSDNENYTGFWESRGYSNSGWLHECSPGTVSSQPEGHTARTDCCTCHSAN